MNDKQTLPAMPDYLKSLITQNNDTESLASSSTSVPRISLRGRKFRLIEGGEEIRKPSDELRLVILAVEPEANLFIKTFYEGQYVSGDSSPPTCASSNGIAPDGWVTNPQSNRCMTCPKNQFGSATSRDGKKAKACKDAKRIWGALPEDVSGTVFALNIPVSSLKNVADYAKKLKSNGFPISAVITKMIMEDAEYPKVMFEMDGFLDENSGRQAIERNIARDWDIQAASSVPLLEDSSNKPKALPTVEQSIENSPTKSETNVSDILGKW